MLNEKKKVVPKLRQEVKVKVDIVTSDDFKIYYTGKFQDFTARFIINFNHKCTHHTVLLYIKKKLIGSPGSFPRLFGNTAAFNGPYSYT